jgi:hypothetical protein
VDYVPSVIGEAMPKERAKQPLKKEKKYTKKGVASVVDDQMSVWSGGWN